MIRAACAREADLLVLIAEGGWTGRGDPELHAHLAACTTCADLLEVAAALARERETTVTTAPVPGAGAVWWRSQVRLRQERLRASHRTLAFVQAAILGAGLLGAFAVLGATSLGHQAWPGWQGCLTALDGLRQALDLGAMARSIPWSTSLCLALLAWLAVVPVATHLALRDDSA